MNRVMSHLRLWFLIRPLGLVLATAIAALPTPASAISPEHILRTIFADDSVPSCDQSVVIDTIRSKFETADARVLHAGLALGPVDRIVQDYVGQNDPSPILRRYCIARATLSNGNRTTLYYLLEQDAGIFGMTWNVEFCMLGYEPWHVHDGRCHTVRHRWW